MEAALYNVVGYTSKECTCLDNGRPADYKTSHSGYFLDEGEHGLPLIVPVKSCGDGTFWNMATRTREAAAVDFITAFNWAAAERRNTVLDGKSADIGGKDYTMFKSVKAFNGIWCTPKLYKGLILVVDQITLHLDKAAAVTLKIMSGPDTLHTNTVNLSGGSAEDLLPAGPITVNLANKASKKDFAIYYSVDNDAKAIDSVLHCGCDSKKETWAKVINVEGRQSEDETDMTDPNAISTRNASGLQIFGRFECAGLEWMAEVSTDYWQKSHYGRLIAKTFQMFWALKLVEEVLNSTRAGVYTTLKREALFGKRNKFKKLTTELVPLLAAQMPEFLSHCYQCADPYGFSKQSL
jgi:hypothetical protein